MSNIKFNDAVTRMHSREDLVIWATPLIILGLHETAEIMFSSKERHLFVEYNAATVVDDNNSSITRQHWLLSDLRRRFDFFRALEET